ncbi:hypothetical protein ABBQ32_003309 [Trebouxia sp. C0010 RCD-2024]
MYGGCATKMNESPSDNPLYFWMPAEPTHGAFSHWHVAETKGDDSNIYPTVEHYMMYHKALLFGDQVIAKEVLLLQTPAEVKEAGRRVHGFDRDKWTACREQIVFNGNFLKYTQHQELQRLLLETGSRLLVEASPEDRIWGIGYSAADASQHRGTWGQNLCGKALDKVRAKLRQQFPTTDAH